MKIAPASFGWGRETTLHFAMTASRDDSATICTIRKIPQALVEITLPRTNRVLQLQVTDNGKSFGEEKTGNGSGLKSMRARAGELNGQLEIDSQPEHGTTVLLTARIS